MNKRIIILISLVFFTCSALKNDKQPLLQEPEEKIVTNISGKGPGVLLKLFQGRSFRYPLLAVWLEDTAGKYIQTLYVSRSVATKVFTYAIQEDNRWIISPGRMTRTLPYWAHKKDVNDEGDIYLYNDQQAVPDAYTGATPQAGFTLVTRADGPLPVKFKVMLEINQKWDRNEYWAPDKYPGDEFYKMSCQPALVYEAIIETGSQKKFHQMKLIGYSHYTGKTGELFTDLSTLTTALYIADSIVVRIKK